MCADAVDDPQKVRCRRDDQIGFELSDGHLKCGRREPNDVNLCARCGRLHGFENGTDSIVVKAWFRRFHHAEHQRPRPKGACLGGLGSQQGAGAESGHAQKQNGRREGTKGKGHQLGRRAEKCKAVWRVILLAKLNPAARPFAYRPAGVPLKFPKMLQGAQRPRNERRVSGLLSLAPECSS